MDSYAIDRFEDDWVVLETDAAYNIRIPRAWAPAGAKEGDVITVDLDRSQNSTATALTIAIDSEASEKRLRDVEALRQRLPRGPKGDVSL
jgi:hypothetical protein